MELGRKILIEALTGSRNYNLETESSDRDYKIFTAPTFNDLYSGQHYKENIITDTVDKDIKDIRQLPNLLWKSNIAYLELLFSKELSYDRSNTSLKKLFELKEDIARLNLPQLFNATGGMYNRRMKLLDKGTDGTQHLVDKYGYNTKEAMHMFRTIFILIKYYNRGFRYFQDCIRHTDEERAIMLNIKDGALTRDEFVDFVTKYHDNHFAPLKSEYHAHQPNEELMQYVDNLIEEVIKQSVFEEIYPDFT